MANDLSNIMPKILARGLLTLREQCRMPRIVNGDYSAEAAQKGTTIDVPVPTKRTAHDVTPSNTPPVPEDTTPDKVQIQLNKWKAADFVLTDKDLVQIEANKHFMPMSVQEAIRALSNEVNTSIQAEYKGVYGYTGTAGTTPFASAATDAVNARKVLNSQLCPRDNRRGVLNYDAEANALALPTFADAEKVGSSEVKIEGELGRKYGIDWYTDDAVPTHTAGTLTGTITTSGAHAVGAKTVLLATDAGEAIALKAGDIVTFAGDTQTYVVGADLTVGASSTGSVAINPGLKVAPAAGTAISVKASHVVNLAFHRDALAFANRPLAQSTQEMELGNKILSMQDPLTGLALRLEVSRQYKQVVWEFDILWGAKLVRPELATRIAG